MMEAVDGAHPCIPFQCKLCWYQNLDGRDPIPGREDIYVTCIRWANIDAMLGKSPMTTKAHRRETMSTIKNALNFGKTLTYHTRGLFPMNNQVSMSLAVDILLKLLVAKGKIVEHVQFATLRKLTATYTKNMESSHAGVKEGAAFANGKNSVRQMSCPAQLEWFHNFLHGLEFLMGCQSDPDHRSLMGSIVHLLGLIRVDAGEAEEAGLTLDASELWKVGTYVCILTAALLRGNKAFYLELAGLWKYLEKGRL
jgi:hypothetical protein